MAHCCREEYASLEDFLRQKNIPFTKLKNEEPSSGRRRYSGAELSSDDEISPTNVIKKGRSDEDDESGTIFIIGL